MPEAALVSGNTYYLYNVEAEMFLNNGNSSYDIALKESALQIVITQVANGTYTMRVASQTNGYIYSASASACSTNNSSYGANSKFSYWSITEDNGCYLIQRSSQNTSYYNADQYLGWQGGNATSILPNCPITDGVHWKLIPVGETASRYIAALKLYKALNTADAFIENGWNLDYYNDLYSARATADHQEMSNAAVGLRNGLNMSQGYQAPYWNEYPILWQTSIGTFGQGYDYTWALPNNSNTTGTYFSYRMKKSGVSSLSATVKVDEASTFIYGLSGSTSDVSVTVYVDGVITRELVNEQISTYTTANSNNYTYTRYFETLEPGTHTIKWVFNSTSSDSDYRYCNIRNAGVMKSPLITVSLLEPGSLGTEVLYNTDHIKNVRRLKVKGKMNSDDWAKIKMMHYLQDLDLSEAEFTEIPAYQFSCAADTSSLFIHAMRLPEGLKKINREAFRYSFIDHMDFPSTVTTVDVEAFSYSHLQELIFPDNLTTINSSSSNHVFNNMYWLKKLVCPKNLTEIPPYTFYQNYYCVEVTLPEQLTKIGNWAFYQNKSMSTTFPNKLQTIGAHAFNQCSWAEFSPLPESLQSIGDDAFYNCNGMKTLKIPENVSSIGEYAFCRCYYLTEVELGTKIYNLSKNVFDNCTRLETLRMNCPTVVTYNTNSSYYPVTAGHIKDVTLIVPNHIVTSYKLDNYWYNFKSIEGFSTSELQDWTINNPLVLNHDRFEGNPNITINGSWSKLTSLKINGSNSQEINNLKLCGSDSDYKNLPGMILCNSDNVVINGMVRSDHNTWKGKWVFLCFPYDVRIADIISGNSSTQKAIRYYDGANRAEKGRSGSWKNYGSEDIIPAGTGFIVQTNLQTWCGFPSFNETKQNIVANREFTKVLAENHSEVTSNKGWNLVGNPWQCFYNNHMLNFTGPITVWDVKNSTYTAYSITDDDYAIRPNEAFFVQCPSAEYNTIGFPTQGRQLTSVIESQNAVKGRAAAASPRQLINVKISNGENEDMTRVVLNEQASMGYELSCDAGKMMSIDASVPQIYTLGEDDEEYAINERPVGTGIIPLGIYTATGGTYTLSLDRCDADNVTLVDYETATEQPLVGDYTFSANAGYDNGRFALKFNTGTVTGIDSANEESLNDLPCYNVAGQRVTRDAKGIIIVGGRKIFNK